MQDGDENIGDKKAIGIRKAHGRRHPGHTGREGEEDGGRRTRGRGLERAMGGREKHTLGPERRGECEGRRNERSL